MNRNRMSTVLAILEWTARAVLLAAALATFLAPALASAQGVATALPPATRCRSF